MRADRIGGRFRVCRSYLFANVLGAGRVEIAWVTEQRVYRAKRGGTDNVG